MGRVTVNPRRILIVLVAAGPVPAMAGDAAPPVDFAREVAPLIVERCLSCHNAGRAKGGLDLSSAGMAFSSGDTGPVIVPGRPEESALLERISPLDDARPEMPQNGDPLAAEQVALVRRWIAEGASWPQGLVLRERAQADLSWWSLHPLARVDPPAPESLPDAWSSSPIDRFVGAALHAEGLSPSPAADRRTLIRRVTYDLTGLPPSPAEVAAFARDERTDAYERLVDRLLASPHYGERWGRHWLDVARFGESTGFERNLILDNAWPYRDSVIRSFNADKPFDRFVLEQLAGDVVGPHDPDAAVGTAFLVAGPYDNVGNQDPAQAAQIRANTLDEIVAATGTAFLGLTIGCARCHDHKFDPIPQDDYYRMQAAFAGVSHGEREIAAPGQPPRPVWAGTFRQPKEPAYLMKGGDPAQRGPTIAPASLTVLGRVTASFALPPDAPESQRRLALARWIAGDGNPLTARVLANRVWHYHFGTGIVDTPSDFGFLGGRPTHPALLDWLARRLLHHGWRIKPLHREILLSQAYRQSGRFREEAARVDAAARLLWRFPPRRLSAEEVRDTILALAGTLDARMGGPGFRLYRYQNDNVSTYVPLDAVGPETYRRAVYHQGARAARVDLLSDFDCPDPASSAPARPATTTPLQTLTLMNHAFLRDMARALAGRLEREAGRDDPAAQVRRAFALAFSRAPAPDEERAAVDLIRGYGLPVFCRALLNANELIYLE